MFYQIKVAEKQRCFLKFLWWKDNDCNTKAVPFQMNIHIFGGSLSPSVSNFALKK